MTAQHSSQERRTPPRPLELIEMAAFIDAVRHPDLLMFTVIAINTLARRDEILRMKRSQCDLIGNRVVVSHNGGRQWRTIPIAPNLAKWLKLEVTDSEYCVSRNGSPTTQTQFRAAWSAAQRRSGLGGVASSSSIRFGMARQLVGRGVSPNDLGWFLGLQVSRQVADLARLSARDFAPIISAIEDTVADVKALLRVIDLESPERHSRR
jgi:integrase